MRKMILILSLVIGLFANDLIQVENYLLEDGRYKGQQFTGHINIEGLPEGQGTLMCKHDNNILNYKGFFENGKIVKGYERECKVTTDYTNIKLFIYYEGEFEGDEAFWVDGGKMKLIVDTIPNKLDITSDASEIENEKAFLGLKEVNGIYRDARSSGQRHFKGIGLPRFILDEAVLIFDNDLNGIKKRKCRVSIKSLNYCIDGVFYQEWNNGLIFDGYINETGNAGKYYDGTFIWPDGTEYNYKGKEWLNSEKRLKIKKRLDIVNKSKPKQNEETKSSITVEKIKPVKEYNPGVIIENKRPSKEYKEKELAPINME